MKITAHVDDDAKIADTNIDNHTQWSDFGGGKGQFVDFTYSGPDGLDTVVFNRSGGTVSKDFLAMSGVLSSSGGYMLAEKFDRRRGEPRRRLGHRSLGSRRRQCRAGVEEGARGRHLHLHRPRRGGQGFTVVYSYTPTSPTAGAFSYAGSGGGVTMQGSGTYTITGADPDPLTLTGTASGCVDIGGCRTTTDTITLTRTSS